MKKALGILALVFVCQSIGWSQDFDKIMAYVAQTPKEAEESIESLSQHLAKPFLNEREKFASIYSWVTLNIKYDVKSYRIQKLFDARTYSVPQMKIREVWEKRKGVCEHYALLFHELSQKAGLQSAVVVGYTINGGRVSDEGHAWNAIMVDSVWFLVDATWGSGYVDGSTFYPVFKPEYFMVKPEESIQSHMPVDPLWQLLPEPVSYTEFDTLPILKVKEGPIDPVDLNSILFSSNEIERTASLIERIKKNGRSGKVVAEYLEYEENKLEILKFNQGISYYNQSIHLFIKYADAYNRRFKNPEVPDQEVEALMDSADIKILEAIKYFNEHYQDEKLDEKARNQKVEALALHEKIKEQMIFVDKYMKTSKFFRPFLFLHISFF